MDENEMEKLRVAEEKMKEIERLKKGLKVLEEDKALVKAQYEECLENLSIITLTDPNDAEKLKKFLYYNSYWNGKVIISPSGSSAYDYVMTLVEGRDITVEISND
ncbi:hypothetical protein OROMI_017167 [Orobanche minor]